MWIWTREAHSENPRVLLHHSFLVQKIILFSLCGGEFIEAKINTLLQVRGSTFSASVRTVYSIYPFYSNSLFLQADSPTPLGSTLCLSHSLGSARNFLGGRILFFPCLSFPPDRVPQKQLPSLLTLRAFQELRTLCPNFSPHQGSGRCGHVFEPLSQEYNCLEVPVILLTSAPFSPSSSWPVLSLPIILLCSVPPPLHPPD